MYRLRFAALAVLALGAGLISGCCGLAHRPLLGGRHAPDTDCCDIGAVPDGDIGLGGGSCCTAPGLNGNPAVLPPPNLGVPGTPPSTVPPGGDKLVPIPNNAPRMPYNPGQ